MIYMKKKRSAHTAEVFVFSFLLLHAVSSIIVSSSIELRDDISFPSTSTTSNTSIISIISISSAVNQTHGKVSNRSDGGDGDDGGQKGVGVGGPDDHVALCLKLSTKKMICALVKSLVVGSLFQLRVKLCQ